MDGGAGQVHRTTLCRAAQGSDLRHDGDRSLPVRARRRGAVETLWKRLPMTTAITDLYRHLRCADCDEKGQVEIDAWKALGYDRVE